MIIFECEGTKKQFVAANCTFPQNEWEYWSVT